MAVKEGLNISPHKTAIVPFTNRRRIEGLGLDGLVLSSVRSIDGEEHEINSFEDYFRLVDIIRWEDDDEGLLE
jgi:hypothetical protein